VGDVAQSRCIDCFRDEIVIKHAGAARAYTTTCSPLRSPPVSRLAPAGHGRSVGIERSLDRRPDLVHPADPGGHVIGNAYDWQFILELIRKRLMFGEDVWLEDQTGAVSSNAFVCSSLYSTAHAYATDVTISDKLNGLCVPAYLVMNTRHFETIDLQWCKIA
jgi:hypothetical protein